MRSKKLKRKVLSYQIIVLEDDAQVELEIDFEVSGLKRRAREKPRECHVDGNVDLRADVAIGDLKVLNLRRVLAVSFGTPAGFHPNKLKFNAFDWNLRVMDRDEPVEWLGQAADGRVEGSRDEEPRN